MFLENSIFNVKNNTLIIIDGNDKYKFIQGIISNDIEILKKKKKKKKKKNQYIPQFLLPKEDLFMIFLLQLGMIIFFLNVQRMIQRKF